ncbi:VOC family protein [Pleionea sp. CnH1-48]|uniref:VOC family protein n=1 Tax=Pleionea sp. CnH1-48 TaxID=2954494 RepID=UPI002096F15E|nr:VOC family protein [Pleionea sp. CnH1-48]MCO7222698.1 VOC family protein [Pleionea sp. CnH1-48]
MPKIETLLLRCKDPQAQVRFYCDHLGMTEFDDGSVGYGGEQAKFRFIQTDGVYEPQRNDVYWKIALAVPNIELAYKQLVAKGIDVGQPRQFKEIGYLAHFCDPEGFTIELIEHWFLGNRQDDVIDPELLGGGAHFNLLTLRTADIAPVNEACLSWGMTPLSIQPVEDYNFTLYFYAFTSDTPPSSDLQAVDNREWLYQRQYTVLEVQHLLQDSEVRQPKETEPGYAGMVISGLADSTDDAGLIVRASA